MSRTRVFSRSRNQASPSEFTNVITLSPWGEQMFQNKTINFTANTPPEIKKLKPKPIQTKQKRQKAAVPQVKATEPTKKV